MFACRSRAEFLRWTSRRFELCRELIRLARYQMDTPVARFRWSSGLIIRGRKNSMLKTSKSAFVLLIFLLIFAFLPASAQDWIHTGTNRGAPIRLAVPDFKGVTGDPQTAPLNTVFNQTLWNDLDNSGVFEMVSKNFYPLQV